MRDFVKKRDREMLTIATIVIFAFLTIVVCPKKIDEGLAWFISVGNFNISFGLNQTVRYLVDVPQGWLDLKNSIMLTGLFSLITLCLTFYLGKIFFEGNSPLSVINVKQANYLTPSRYYFIDDKFRFAVILEDGKVVDLCGSFKDLEVDIGVNDHPEKKFVKAPNRKGQLRKVGNLANIVEKKKDNSQEKEIEMNSLVYG